MAQKPDDNIPTLDEMIFPGKPEKIESLRRAAAAAQDHVRNNAPPATVREQIARTPRDPGATVKPAPKQSNFEILINKQIDAILQKHIQAAREEIVRVVMLELRARLPSTSKRSPERSGD
ncbi:MAG: hypothetical protein ACFCUG_00350 [Thiotrichales bacterium]